jgi:hypothetical protein
MPIKTFEEACKKLKLDPAAILPDVSRFPAKHQKAITATAKMYIVAEALNEGWEPNWNDSDEYKYFPWFDMEEDKKNNPSGFRFVGTYFDYSVTYSAGGSRLCFKSQKLSDYCATQFVELWRDMMVLSK